MTIIFACAAPSSRRRRRRRPAQAAPVTLVVARRQPHRRLQPAREAAFPAVLERAPAGQGPRRRDRQCRSVGRHRHRAGSTGSTGRSPTAPTGSSSSSARTTCCAALDPAVARQAIETIVARLKARGIPVMLAGMYAARNLGPDYVQNVRRALSGDCEEARPCALSLLPRRGRGRATLSTCPTGFIRRPRGWTSSSSGSCRASRSFLARLAQR